MEIFPPWFFKGSFQVVATHIFFGKFHPGYLGKWSKLVQPPTRWDLTLFEEYTWHVWRIFGFSSSTSKIWGVWPIVWYCWWKKSCTSWGWYSFLPLFTGFFYIPGAAGFLPSTVVIPTYFGKSTWALSDWPSFFCCLDFFARLGVQLKRNESYAIGVIN